MKQILLLGPADDQCLQSLARYLDAQNCPYAYISDFTSLSFSIWNHTEEPNQKQQIDIRIDSESVTDQMGIIIRFPYAIVPKNTNADTAFQAQEYFAALWSFCALHPGVVINRPGLTEWQYEDLLKHRLFPGQYVSEYRAEGTDRFKYVWEKALHSGYHEIHVENMVTYKRSIQSNAESLNHWLESAGAYQYRAVIAESSRYLIQIVVGDWIATVFNELDYNPDSEAHKAYMNRIVDKLVAHGIHFFAVAFTLNREGLSIVRIDPYPQFDWYAGIANAVNEQLMAALQSGSWEGGRQGDLVHRYIK